MMGLFKNLMDKIFRAGGYAEAPPDAWKPGEPRGAAPLRPGGPAIAPAAAGQQQPAPGTAAPAAPAAPIDIAAVLEKMAESNKEKLDWKHSIVDLMKLVGLDSSLAARRELAEDLHYTGDTKDTATMNMWLHKQVMRRLAENGGKVPADLLTD